MNDLEDLLTRELAEVADSLHPPRVDTLGVRRVVAHERRRHLATAAVAAAAVVAVALASLLLPRPGGADVEPAGGLDALPLGAPLALPWAERDGTVHLPGGPTLRVDTPFSLSFRGGTTLVAESLGDTSRWSLVDDRGAEPVLRTVSERVSGSPVVAVDGSRVAWAEAATGPGGVTDAQDLVLHVLDVTSLTTTEVDVAREPGTAALVGVTDVDDRGRVLVARRDGTDLLVEPEGTVELTDTRDGLTLLTDGRGVRYDAGEPTELVDLADDGGLSTVAELVPGYVSSPAPDAATYVAASSDAGRLEPVSLAEDGRTTPRGPLPLPTGDGQEWSVLGWESATDLVVHDVSTPGWTDLVRCSVDTGGCERVPGTFDTVGGW